MCTPASRWYQSLNHIQYVLSLPLAIRYKVAYKKDSGECKLEISMTFADDAGEYSVFAKNQLGEVSASANLLEEGISILLFLCPGIFIISYLTFVYKIL